MNTWAPLFSKIVDSSLWSEPDHVCKVFITLLAKKDADQVSRLNAFEIGSKCWPGDPEKEVRALDALKILSEPDGRRVEPQPFEGRRIEKVADGWLILNGQVYEDMMRKIKRRDYNRDWMVAYRAKDTKPKKRRARDAGKPLKGESEYVRTAEEQGAAAAEAVVERHLPEPTVANSETVQKAEREPTWRQQERKLASLPRPQPFGPGAFARPGDNGP